MITTSHQVVSPTRRYVAVCNKANWTGHYFRRFTLPETDRYGRDLQNNASVAAWYFLNRLSFTACIEGCFTQEDFEFVTDETNTLGEAA